MAPSRPCAEPAFPAITRLVAVVVIPTALVVLVLGWCLDVATARSLVPGTVGMKPATATMFLLAATAIAVLGTGQRLRSGRACGVGTAVIGLAFLAEYVLGVDLGIDELPFRDETGRAAGIAFPGRLAPTTAVCFVTVGIALAAVGTRAGRMLCDVAIVVVTTLGGTTLLGYLYDIPAFYGAQSAAKMAVNTGGLFLVLAMGLLVLRPRPAVERLARSPDPGSAMVRRLLPLCVVLPLLLGWLRIKGVEQGLYDERVGTWLLTAGTMLGLVVTVIHAGHRLGRADVVRLALEQELRRIAQMDELTGVASRRHFGERLTSELARGRRHGENGALLVVDLDGFKAVNDLHGHAAGDEILRHVGLVLKAHTRASDVVGRTGGDEFAAYLPHTDAATGTIVADRLREAIEALYLPVAPPNRVSASIGLAERGSRADATALLAAADAAMYRAKQAGGGRVVVAPLADPGAPIGAALAPDLTGLPPLPGGLPTA